VKIRGRVSRKVPLTKLRDYSKLHWPPGVEPNPPWAGPAPEAPDPFRVIVKGIELVEASEHRPRHLTLTGEYHGNVYHTTLVCDDAKVLTNLWQRLRQCVGESVERIGEHEVNKSGDLA
jgi:hypothetical protein